MAKRWELVAKQEGVGQVVELLYWPHENGGGNRKGEYWVRKYLAIGLSVDNSYYWGPGAEERAREDFRTRISQ